MVLYRRRTVYVKGKYTQSFAAAPPDGCVCARENMPSSGTTHAHMFALRQEREGRERERERERGEKKGARIRGGRLQRE